MQNWCKFAMFFSKSQSKLQNKQNVGPTVKLMDFIVSQGVLSFKAVHRVQAWYCEQVLQ